MIKIYHTKELHFKAILCTFRPRIVDMTPLRKSFLQMPAHDTGDESNMNSATTVPTEETQLVSGSDASQTTEPEPVRMKQRIEQFKKRIKLAMKRTYVVSCDERVSLFRKVICVAALTFVIVTVWLDIFIFPGTLSMMRIMYHILLCQLAISLTTRMIPERVWNNADRAVDAREVHGNGGEPAWTILSVIWTIQLWCVFCMPPAWVLFITFDYLPF